MRTAALLAFLLTAVLSARAEIRGEEIEYQDGSGTVFRGYLAYDDASAEPRPGVLVVHEWWGHNEYVRDRAEQLAAMGYTALAVDMYGDGQRADHPDDAGAFAGAVMQQADQGRARFLAARDVLTAHATVDASDVAAIGYCFGGGVVLTMARAGVALDGVASFHGSLSSPVRAEPGAVKARVLVLHGGADTFIPPDQIAEFTREMATAGAAWEFVSYPGVLHSFTNREADAFAARFDMPVAYDAHADADSWARLDAFLEEVFAD
ncbi:MAG: dienelactone hydrolase family protein [Pseudomonadales bacterium]|jgi:dienelactone hydrolase|nr:dienelactone hydrolase family protein [Pseudomonadales bacterium]